MNARLKRTKNVTAGNSAWLANVGKTITAIGGEAFPQILVDAIKSLADFDWCVVFAYYQSERPICPFHTFPLDRRIIHVDDYLKGPYLLDPFFKACTRRVDTGLYRMRDLAPDRFYQSEYYRSYYGDTGLAEEICYTLYLPKGVALVISLMRSGAMSRYSAREFRVLESIVPVVTGLAQRHWQDMPEKFDLKPDENAIYQERTFIENTVSSLFGKRITPRETQVVAQVLEGHSSDSIAKDLGITVGTVRIHRRNIYAKLRISSQQELFSIFFKKITTGR